MAIFLNLISFVCALLAVSVITNVTFSSATCTATECSIECADELRHVDMQPSPLPRDCTEILSKENPTSGVYKIQPPIQGLYDSNISAPVSVYCDMDTDGGGWTVFQRRQNGLVDFYRDWEDYRLGFGYVDGDYWLGLQNLFWMTSTAQYELRVDIEDFNGNKVYANYNSFKISEERLFFKLILGDYQGTAGDGLSRHSYKSFSTKDQEHDTWNDGHCAQQFTGAWWYADCLDSNLNGLYMGPSVVDGKGMGWYKWEDNLKVLNKSEMKIRHIG